jgi:dTDP-4-dehydrorhamnose reductase
MTCRAVVTGAGGMLGRELLTQLSLLKYDVVTLSRPTFDLMKTNTLGSTITEISPNIVIHLAAETNVDLCEREPTLAYLANSAATKEIARAAERLGARMIFVSTSSVFGRDEKLFYNELDTAQPISYYAMSKFKGENFVREACWRNYAIVRAGWMIGGGGALDHKFVGKIVQQIKAGQASISAVCDKYGSITRATSLARLICYLMFNSDGTFHFGSNGLTNRFEIAKAISIALDFAGDVLPVTSDAFPLSAPRPRSDGITSVRLSEIPEELRPINWNVDLVRYLKEF